MCWEFVIEYICSGSLACLGGTIQNFHSDQRRECCVAPLKPGLMATFPEFSKMDSYNLPFSLSVNIQQASKLSGVKKRKISGWIIISLVHVYAKKKKDLFTPWWN